MPLNSPFPSDVAFSQRPQAGEPVPPLTPREEQALGPASSARRRAQFALGRACARDALRALGVADSPDIGRIEGRQPRWPEGYVGSITHSHERAAAVAAPVKHYRGIGIDLEQMRTPSDALLRRVCRPEEQDRFGQLPQAPLRCAFTALFAVKESVYKAVNPLTGVYLGFQDAEIAFASGTDWAAGGGVLEWRLLKDSGPDFPSGFSGRGAWRQEAEWVIAGVWIPAQ